MGRNRSKLSDQVRAAVESSGVSRNLICKSTGIDQAALSRFMGGTGITTTTLDKLAEYLGLEIVLKGKPKGRSR